MKRVDIFLGTECNNNCLFCCSKEHKEELSTGEVRNILNNSRCRGNEEVHFTGAEPTIRRDICDLISYAKDLGYKRIKITTNGRMLSYNKFCNNIVDAGLNSVIFSIHGHNPELHDFLTSCDGAFNQLMAGINNVKKKGLYVESNTTIVKPNYRYLKEIAELLVKIRFDSSELIFVHPRGRAAENYDRIVPRFKEVMPYVYDALNTGITNHCKILTTYIPFCMLGEYINLRSEQYEPEHIEHYIKGTFIQDAIKIKNEKLMKKFSQCRLCKYNLMCSGIHKEHLDNDSDFIPIK